MAGRIRRSTTSANFATVFVAAVLISNGALINQAAADDFEACAKDSGDLAITACTRVIKSGNYTGRVLALAYSNRGVEWKGKGQLDRQVLQGSEQTGGDMPAYGKQLAPHEVNALVAYLQSLKSR